MILIICAFFMEFAGCAGYEGEKLTEMVPVGSCFVALTAKMTMLE